MTTPSLNRRIFVAGSVAAVVLPGIALPVSTHAATAQQIEGISGGGSILTDHGPAEFSVFGIRFMNENTTQPIIIGALSYLDTLGMVGLESTSISAFGPVEGSQNTAWQMSGIANMNGTGLHPFDLKMTHGGILGGGADSIELAVGLDGANVVEDIIYEAKSTVQAGGFQLIATPDITTDGSPTPAG